MSNYGAIVTTQLGKNMIAESFKTKKGIIFTKIALGEGLLNNNNIDDLTGLLAKVADGEVSTVNTISNSEIEVVSTINNRALTRGYYARELGLFAKLGENGAEKLFGYTNAGANASYVPSNASIDEKIITITIGIGNASVTLNPKSHIYLTEARLNQHENDINAHSDIMNKYLRLTGGTVTGNIRLNNAAVGFNNGTDTYDAKIRIASNGNFDIGVTEDSVNKNATAQLLLHSQNKPKWYNSDMGGKEIATTEDITNETSKYLLLAGGTITGDVNFANGAWVLFTNNNNVGGIRMLPNGTMDVGVNSQGTAPNINLCSNNRPGWYSPSAGIKQIAIVEEIDAAKKSLIETMDNYLPKAGGTVTGAIDFTRGSLKGHIELKPNGNLDFGSLETKCAVLNSRERPLWYTGDSRGGMLALTRDVIPDPTQCVNLYDAKSEKYQTGRDRGTFNLKAPYTDYDFLIIVLSADDGQFMGLSQINVSWFEKVRKMSIGTGLEIINIATVANCWWGISNKSTPTKMIAYDGYENSHLWEVWGYKITR